MLSIEVHHLEYTQLVSHGMFVLFQATMTMSQELAQGQRIYRNLTSL